MSDVNDTEMADSRSVWSLPGAVFVAASLVVLAGFLIPLPEKMLDVLWVCLFCLAGAVALICVATRNASDLIGFVPMLAAMTLLSLAVESSTARRIIENTPAGFLLGGVGSALASSWPLGAVLICLAMAAISVVVVFAACQKMVQASNGYLGRVLPLKRLGIETDLRIGVLDEDQAEAMARRITAESRFFAGMNGVARLMRAQAAVCIFILLACLIIPAINSAADQPSAAAFLAEIAPPVVALSIFTLMPMLLVAVACGGLMSKEALTLPAGNACQAASMPRPKIKVIPLENDAADNAQSPHPAPVPEPSPQEQIVDFEPAVDDTAPVWDDFSCRDAKAYYERLAEKIVAVDARRPVVLLASERVQSLPVTVAVNLAIHLAQKNQKVLLIDTDTRRNAVAQVFDLPPQSLVNNIQPSCLENLSVSCVPWETLDAFLQNDVCGADVEMTLIYTPCLSAAATGTTELAAAPTAFYFMDGADPVAARKAVETLAFCRSVSLFPSLQSAIRITP